MGEGVQKYAKFADKQYRFSGQRGWTGSNVKKCGCHTCTFGSKPITAVAAVAECGGGGGSKSIISLAAVSRSMPARSSLHPICLVSPIPSSFPICRMNHGVFERRSWCKFNKIEEGPKKGPKKGSKCMNCL